MKIWLIACIAVAFGLSTACGQPLDPCPPGHGDDLALEGEEAPGGGLDLEPAPAPPGQRDHRGGAPGTRGPRLRELRENIKSVKAELDLLTGEIRNQAARLRQLREEIMDASDEQEKAALAQEMRDVVEKLSRYEILLAEKKVEISKKAYDRSLDRYVRAQIELEEARRKLSHRRKRLERGLLYRAPPPGGPPPETPGSPERSPGEGEPLPDA